MKITIRGTTYDLDTPEDAEAYDLLHKVEGLWYREAIWAQRIPAYFQFEIGAQYLTLEGKIITIMERSTLKYSECVRGDDGIWRYNRIDHPTEFGGPDGLGRTTGSQWNCPTNLIPVKIIAASDPINPVPPLPDVPAPEPNNLIDHTEFQSYFTPDKEDSNSAVWFVGIIISLAFLAIAWLVFIN